MKVYVADNGTISGAGYWLSLTSQTSGNLSGKRLFLLSPYFSLGAPSQEADKRRVTGGQLDMVVYYTESVTVSTNHRY
jgi:hypothetical protein